MIGKGNDVESKPFHRVISIAKSPQCIKLQNMDKKGVKRFACLSLS